MTNGQTFIDWMDIRQTYTGQNLPIVGGGVLVKGDSSVDWAEDGGMFILVRADTGFSNIVRPLQHEGSHSTKLLVRCDGTHVRLSGNIGRFGRPDNIFNYDLSDTVAIANEVTSSKELPAFSSGHKCLKDSMSARDVEAGLNPWHWSGAHFNELHATRNFSAGNEALAKEAMRYMNAKRGARLAKGVYGDETLVFGRQSGKLHKRVVVYRKAAELLSHAKGDLAKAALKKSQEYQFAADTGLVRIECKWGSCYLRDRSLRYLGDATMGKIISLFDAETDFLFDAAPERIARLVDEIPIKLRSAALHWIRGDDLRQLYSRATYFRHVKALRDYGLDVAEPRKVDQKVSSEEQLQAMLDSLPKFNLRPMVAPDWYGLPDIKRAA